MTHFVDRDRCILKDWNYSSFKRFCCIAINTEEVSHMFTLYVRRSSNNTGSNFDSFSLCWWWWQLWISLLSMLLEWLICDKQNNSLNISVFMAWKHSSFCHGDTWVREAEMLHDQMRFLALKIEKFNVRGRYLGRQSHYIPNVSNISLIDTIFIFLVSSNSPSHISLYYSE